MRIKAEVVILQDNKVIHKQRANTLVRAFFQIMTVQLGQANVTNVVDTGGTARTVVTHASNLAVNATTVSYGIVIGSGTSSWSFTDFRLASQIVGIYHSNCSASFTSENKLIIVRSFVNSLSSSVTINEIGLYAAAMDSGNSTRYFCIDRTLLSQSIVLEPSRSLSVAYEITYA